MNLWRSSSSAKVSYLVRASVASFFSSSDAWYKQYMSIRIPEENELMGLNKDSYRHAQHTAHMFSKNAYCPTILHEPIRFKCRVS